MKILIIGGNGTIGKKVSLHFNHKYQVIIGGRNSGDLIIDISESKPIKPALEQVGMLDAIVFIAGESKWASFEKLTEEDFYIGLRSKLMGQVNVVRIGKN